MSPKRSKRSKPSHRRRNAVNERATLAQDERTGAASTCGPSESGPIPAPHAELSYDPLDVAGRMMMRRYDVEMPASVVKPVPVTPTEAGIFRRFDDKRADALIALLRRRYGPAQEQHIAGIERQVRYFAAAQGVPVSRVELVTGPPLLGEELFPTYTCRVMPKRPRWWRRVLGHIWPWRSTR